jgi:hypothetical protein
MIREIELRDLKKGDYFIYNAVEYVVTDTEKHFYARAVEGYRSIGIFGRDAAQSKMKVQLIKSA